MSEIMTKIWPVVLLLLLLPGARGIGQEGGEQERAKLEGQQKQLRGKIETLKQEQDFLQFQNEFYVSDSKYLLLDFSKRSGQLKYKNRVLKSFKFTPLFRPSAHPIPPGVLILTRKIEPPRGRRALIFGTVLIIRLKSSAAAKREDGKVPRIAVSKSDMASLFYAVEEGSRAYVVR